MVIACGCQNFKSAVSQIQDRNVERAAAQVKDEDFLFLVSLVDTERQRCRRRFVDDPFYFQTRDLAGVFRCLTLCVVEVSRNGDDSLVNLLA